MNSLDRINLCHDPTVSNAENNLRYKSEVNGKPYLTTSFTAESAIVTRATRVLSPFEYHLVEGRSIGLHSDVPKHDWLLEGEKKTIGDNSSALKNLDDHFAANSKKSLPTPTHDHPNRTYHRTVFKDCCSTLYSLMDYAEYALAMVQVIQGMSSQTKFSISS